MVGRRSGAGISMSDWSCSILYDLENEYADQILRSIYNKSY